MKRPSLIQQSRLVEADWQGFARTMREHLERERVDHEMISTR